MGICMTSCSGAKARIDANEDADEVWGKRVYKLVAQVGVFAGRGVGRGRSLAFLGRRRW